MTLEEARKLKHGDLVRLEDPRGEDAGLGLFRCVTGPRRQPDGTYRRMIEVIVDGACVLFKEERVERATANDLLLDA